MQKRSHKLLASILLAQHQGFGSRCQEAAFLFGSFQPDCNPLSYLKGSLHGRKFHGHDFSNSHRYIRRSIFRLQQRRRWHLWQYYTLGKLTHYLADAFTYPHNQPLPLQPRLHHQYETRLRRHLAAQLASQRASQNTVCPNVWSAMEALHRHYLHAPAGICTDTQYIWRAAELAMTLCPPAHRKAA